MKAVSCRILLALAAPALLAACQGVESLQPPGLEVNTWQLVELGGAEPVSLPAGQQAHLLFDSGPPQRVSGSTGCNRLVGGYVLAGQNLEFRALATTRMACAPEAMALEQRFAAALDATRGWQIVDGTLELLDEQGGLLARFEARGN